MELKLRMDDQKVVACLSVGVEGIGCSSWFVVELVLIACDVQKEAASGRWNVIRQRGL